MTIDDATIHLAHDWLVGLRGGERVLDRICQLCGPTVLYTMVADGRPLTPAIDACEIRTSRLQRLPAAAGRLRRHYLPLYAWAVDGIRVSGCDLLISTSSAAIKSLRTPETVFLMCATAIRRHGMSGSNRRTTRSAREAGCVVQGCRPHAAGSRGGDHARAANVTHFLANSEHTAARIRRCFDRDAEVVYPPVRTEYFTRDESVDREDWYLVVSALEPYKRTDLVIQAANQAGVRLKVAGSGSQSDELRAMAGPTVEMLGRVDDDALRGLFRQARALIFPQQEDFGIVPVEAQATGCPMIAYARGGALETVTEQTGVFFDEQTADSLVDAIRRFDTIDIDPAACSAHANRFSESRFDEAMHAVIRQMSQLVNMTRAVTARSVR